MHILSKRDAQSQNSIALYNIVFNGDSVLIFNWMRSKIDFLLLMILFQLFFRKRSTTFEIGHGKCRSLVCVVCYQKASRSLSELEIKNVQDYLIDGYSSSHPDFPNGICTGCSIVLSKKRKDSTITLPAVENFNPERKTELRSLNACSCKFVQ